MSDFFSNDAGLPMDLMIDIVVRLPPCKNADLKLVSKKWYATLTDGFIRELQLSSWRRLYLSYMLFCSSKISFRQHFRLFHFYNFEAWPWKFKSVLDHEWFENIISCSLIGVCDGIICFKYRCLDDVPRLLICNPLTRRMRKINVPSIVPDSRRVKFCFGCLPDPNSYHILVIFEHEDNHRLGYYLYNSSSAQWSNLGELNFHMFVWESNFVTISGVIYLLSQAPYNAIDPLDYVVCFDIAKSEFRRFRCPNIIQSRACNLLQYKSKLGVMVQIRFLDWGMCRYYSMTFEDLANRVVGVNLIQGSPCIYNGSFLIGFIEGDYIVDVTNKGLRIDKKIMGQVSLMFHRSDGEQLNRVMEIYPANVVWEPINIFEYHANFMSV